MKWTLSRTVTVMPEWIGNPALWAIVSVSLVSGTFAIGVGVGSVNADRKKFDQFMFKIDNDLDGIRTTVETILLRLHTPAVEGNGPVRLTDFGKEISATVNARKRAEEQATDLVGAATGKEEFEVFDICVNHVSKAFEDDLEFRKIVRSGAYQIGTETLNVLKVCQVELRDRVLELIPD